MSAYYNEVEPYAAAWLRALIAAGLVPAGDVDERSIADVQPDDVRGYAQCHWFAGLGGWAYAARLAGWPDERPLWTGSCPCQPFSVAGKGRGANDERDLWPEFYRLIAACRPPVVFGEQVANAAKARDIKGQDVRRMRRAQALQQLLRGQEGQDAEFLHRMLQGDGAAEEDWYESRALGLASEVEEGEPSLDAYHSGALSGQAEGVGVRSGRVETGIGGTHQPWCLRADWLAPEFGRRPDLGQPLLGSDQPGGGLHDLQRPGRSVRSQCDDEHMGAGQGAGNCGRPQGQDAGSRGPSSRGMGSGPETASEPSWFDGIVSDLEAVGYACRASVIPACAVDAPHRRDRLWFGAVADAAGGQLPQPLGGSPARNGAGSTGAASGVALGDALPAGLSPSEREAVLGAGRGREGRAVGEPGRALGHAGGAAAQLRREPGELPGAARAAAGEGHQRQWGRNTARHSGGGNGGVADADEPRSREGWEQRSGQLSGAGCDPRARHGRNGTFWSDAAWLVGADGKARRAQSGIRLLAHGVPARVGRLRAYGNAIVPQVAAEVIAAFMECAP